MTCFIISVKYFQQNTVDVANECKFLYLDKCLHVVIIMCAGMERLSVDL